MRSLRPTLFPLDSPSSYLPMPTTLLKPQTEHRVLATSHSPTATQSQIKSKFPAFNPSFQWGTGRFFLRNKPCGADQINRCQVKIQMRGGTRYVLSTLSIWACLEAGPAEILSQICLTATCGCQILTGYFPPTSAFSFTQYVPGGLFWFVDAELRLIKDLRTKGPEHYQKMLDDQPCRWRRGLDLCSMVDEIANNN